MSATRARHPFSRAIALFLLGLLFVSLNIVASFMLGGRQLDLTENKLYTLSNGTREILGNLDEPVRLRLFYSRNQASGYPALRVYADRVRSLLSIIKKAGGDRLVVEEVEPAPYSEEEDIALAMGLTPLAPETGAPLYFGIVGTNAADGRELIPFLNPAREEYLEYDLANLIHTLSEPGKSRLGLITSFSLPSLQPTAVTTVPSSEDLPLIYNTLADSFDVEQLSAEFETIPQGIGVLLILHPGQLSDKSLYAIDQFAMRGGRILLCVDPLSEKAFSPTGAKRSPEPVLVESRFTKLLDAWGVRIPDGKIVGDRERALLVQAPADPSDDTGITPIIDYVPWLELSKEDFALGDPVMDGIDQINLASAGVLSPIQGRQSRFVPLILSTKDAMLIDAKKLGSRPDPAALLQDFKPAGHNFVLAARISGRIQSAFPDGPPGVSGNQDEKPPSDTLDEKAHITIPRGPANIIVVADTDLFDDRFWIRSTDSFLGQRFSTPSADNSKFIVSAIENLMGSNALISLRARERANRPFVVVEELRREAEARYLAREQQLSADIEETESRLAALQEDRPHAEGRMSVLSAEEQEEVARFRTELLNTRQALRQVQHNLNSEIDALGNRLRVANILFMPLVVIAIAVILLLLSRHRRAHAAKRLERALARREQKDTSVATGATVASVATRAEENPTADMQNDPPAFTDPAEGEVVQENTPAMTETPVTEKHISESESDEDDATPVSDKESLTDVEGPEAEGQENSDMDNSKKET